MVATKRCHVAISFNTFQPIYLHNFSPCKPVGRCDGQLRVGRGATQVATVTGALRCLSISRR